MDDIQRKLALIDRQLAGRNLHKQIISTCPLVFVAVGLIAGILIQRTLFGTGFLRLWLILLALLAAATVFFFIIRQFSSNHNLLFTSHEYTTAYLALACFLCLGAIRLISFHQPKANDIRNLVADERKMATIRGLIVTEPYVNKNRNWKFARFKFTDPATSFYLKLDEVETTGGWAKATGTVRVQVGEPVLDLKAGDYVQAYCWLDRFGPPTNPGQFDTARYLERKNVFIAASVKSRDGIELLRSTHPALFPRLKSKLRQKAAQALLGDISPEEPGRGLLEALLLGYRGNIDSGTYNAFRRTGLLHFISLSGMHLGILVGIIWWLCKTAGLLKPARAVVCIVAVAVFLLIVPPRAPTLRAAIICWVFCLSFFFRRHSNPVNTLSLAAIILLLIRPTQLFEAGWQLSFGTVLGILLFTNRIHFLLSEKLTSLPWPAPNKKRKTFYSIMSGLGSYLLQLFSVGFAAWLGGAGILLYHFYTITPLASLWTMLVFPLVGVILVFGFLKIILFFLLPTLSAALGFIVTLLSDFLILLVKLFARLDISQILIGRVPFVLIILYYCLIVFAGFVYLRRPLIKKAVCTVMILTMVFALVVMKWSRTHRSNLVITCLDVGHGQAIFAQFPGQANILFDAGSLHRSDIGRRIITPFLNHIGVRKIDAVIISHNDTDHLNGIPEIIEHCNVGGVYAGDDFCDTVNQWGTAKFLNDRLKESGLEIKPFNRDFTFSNAANIKILWPDELTVKNENLSDNDKSLVSLIDFAGTKILLCSDIEKFAQRGLLGLHPGLRAEVVVVPHHGSVNTLDDDFLEKLEPNILIYSCDRTQYERQRRVDKRKDSPESFYTAKDGAVTVVLEKDGMIKTTTFSP